MTFLTTWLFRTIAVSDDIESVDPMSTSSATVEGPRLDVDQSADTDLSEHSDDEEDGIEEDDLTQQLLDDPAFVQRLVDELVAEEAEGDGTDVDEKTPVTLESRVETATSSYLDAYGAVRELRSRLSDIRRSLKEPKNDVERVRSNTFSSTGMTFAELASLREALGDAEFFALYRFDELSKVTFISLHTYYSSAKYKQDLKEVDRLETDLSECTANLAKAEDTLKSSRRDLLAIQAEIRESSESQRSELSTLIQQRRLIDLKMAKIQEDLRPLSTVSQQISDVLSGTAEPRRLARSPLGVDVDPATAMELLRSMGITGPRTSG